MEKNLPNELICEILSLVFRISDEMFQDVSGISPFSRPDHIPTSTVLCVCKRWMNVATPFLYNVVILRSSAQAKALRRTLRRNKHYGAYIKKFRTEGCYGAAMRAIIYSAPNICDLCLLLDMRASGDVTGLDSSLASINPSRLVVQLRPQDSTTGHSESPLKNVLPKLTACFKSWTNMVSRLYYIIWCS